MSLLDTFTGDSGWMRVVKGGGARFTAGGGQFHTCLKKQLAFPLHYWGRLYKKVIKVTIISGIVNQSEQRTLCLSTICNICNVCRCCIIKKRGFCM